MKRFNIMIRWVLVILWMVVIFYLSHQPASDSAILSGDLTQMIISNIEKFTSTEIDIDSFHHIVRKNAHFFAYLVLGVLVMNALNHNGAKGYKNIIIGILRRI